MAGIFLYKYLEHAYLQNRRAERQHRQQMAMYPAPESVVVGPAEPDGARAEKIYVPHMVCSICSLFCAMLCGLCVCLFAPLAITFAGKSIKLPSSYDHHHHHHHRLSDSHAGTVWSDISKTLFLCHGRVMTVLYLIITARWYTERGCEIACRLSVRLWRLGTVIT